MNSAKRRIIKTTLASVVALSLLVAPINSVGVPGTISVSAAEFNGDFSSGVFDVWDGVSYDFSWYDPTETEFTINSAAQLASLAVLTNDLTHGFLEWANNLPANCNEYKGVVDNFEGKTITLAVDIDLNGMDWLPISYPFDTPNPTRDDFNALGHVSAYFSSVDPWVGDGNGNPIITRYLEYTESEMRFRDLLYFVKTGNAVNTLHDYSYSGTVADRPSYLKYFPQYANEKDSVTSFNPTDWMRFINGLQLHDLHYTEEVEIVGGNGATMAVPVAASYISTYAGQLEVPAYGLDVITTDNPVQSIIYQDVHTGGAVNNGFNGTFDGHSYRIKGIHPDTPWTNDATARLTTYDPIAKGLFGVVDEDGAVKNLNVKGYYDENDVCSYSALLCAYNYGLLQDCYVCCDMEQGLVTMRYPIARDYGEYDADGNIVVPSTYVLSADAGTVLPVGNSGIVTAYNASTGIIDNCTSAGAVTQAFRQFGFITCTNDGTIKGNCRNKASFNTHDFTIDFTTDEWNDSAYYYNDSLTGYSHTYGGSYYSAHAGHSVNMIQSTFPLAGARLSSLTQMIYDGGNDLRDNFMTKYGGYNFFAHVSACPTSSDYYQQNPEGITKLTKMQEYAEAQGKTPQWSSTSFEDWLRVVWPYGIKIAEAGCFYPSDGLPGYYQGSAETGEVWIPSLYNTEEGESIAANHLYGIYGMTAVGGICAINNGVINGAINESNLQAMKYTSPRYNCRPTNEEGTSTNHSNYNYIRPTNAYGLFSTQSNTVTYVAGICVINHNKVMSAQNQGDITENKCDYITYIPDSLVGIICYTDNKFYRTGCVAQYDEGIADKEFYPLAFQWWWDFITDDCEGKIVSVAYGDGDSAVTAEGLSRDIVKQVARYPQYDWEWSEDKARRTDSTTGELVTEIHIDQVDNPDFVDLDSNMPYPVFVKSFALPNGTYNNRYSNPSLTQNTCESWASGITVYNYGTLDGVENDGVATFGICLISDGKDSTAVIKNVKQLASGCKENVGFYLLNTSVENGEIRNTVGSSYGIARYVRSTNGLSPKQSNISVYEGISGYELVEGDSARIPVSNIVLYDTDHNGDTVARTATNVDFKNIVNFQESENGVSNKLENCNLENIYVYSDVVYNGIGSGTIQSYMRNVNYFGHTAGEYALGVFTGGSYSDLTVNMLDTTGTLGETKHLLKASNASIANLIAFLKASDTGLLLENCSLDEAMVYMDTPAFGTSKNYYANEVRGCNVSNALLECKVGITDLDPMSTSFANLPGVLKNLDDTSVFENVVVQTPNSCVSYPSFNFSSRIDKSITSDAYLDKDTNARASGAMAYWADHGNQSDRTFDYTVAVDDAMNIMPSDCLSIIDPDCTNIDDNSTIALPVYTRRKVSANEESVRRVLIPYTSKGAGEVKGTYYDGATLISETDCLRAMFPQTSMYVPVGAPYTLHVNEEPGYGLLHLYETSASVDTHEIDFERDTDMQFIMPDEDVTYTSVWTYCYDINKAEIPNVTITTSADAAIANEIINVDTVCTSDAYEIARVYYADYKLDTNNRWVITTVTHDIPLNEMSFVMPAHPVKIFVDLASTNCEVTQFVLAGQTGIIDNINHTIEVFIDSSVSIDIHNIHPTIFNNTAASVSPDWTIDQDFTKPVKYVLTAENGTAKEYTVNVIYAEDGQISRFDLLGYAGIIDQDAGIIAVSLPVEMNLTSITPSIVWRGSSITPSGAVNLTSLEAIYTVTSSTGEEKTYTVSIVYPDTSKVISDFKIVDSNDTLVNLVVDDAERTITAHIPYGFDVADCIVNSFKYAGVSASVTEGTTVDLLSLSNITLVDINGDTLVYRFIVTELPSTQKRIVKFSILGSNGIIDDEAGTITVMLPSCYDISDISPDAVLFIGKNITENYYASHDWLSDAVTLTVNAYDGSTKVYTVSVTQMEG